HLFLAGDSLLLVSKGLTCSTIHCSEAKYVFASQVCYRAVYGCGALRSLAEFISNLWADMRIRQLAHLTKGLLNTGIGNQAQKGGLFELDRQTLPQRAVKNGVAGGVGEIGEHNRVLFREDSGAMKEQPRRASSDRNQNDACNSNPSPIAGFLDLHLNLGM